MSAAADAALLALLGRLDAAGYTFVTPTPATHARVVARPDRREACDLAEVFGWSLRFTPDVVGDALLAVMRRAEVVEENGGKLRSLVRVSRVAGRLFLHSAYPTHANDAVFLGPDSYRFADLIAAEIRANPPPPEARIADIGTGAGVGAIAAADACSHAKVTMTDINPAALRLARINAAAAGVAVEAIETSILAGIAGPFDLVTANPPYIVDVGERSYRHGGAMHGGALSLTMAQDGAAKLAAGGRMILYTGSAIVRGEDRLHAALGEVARAAGCTLRYREIDPDMFGEELDEPGYAEVDRIAIVAAVLTRADQPPSVSASSAGRSS